MKSNQPDSPPSYKEFIHSKQVELTQPEEPPYEELYEQESDLEVYESEQIAVIYENVQKEAMLQKRLDQHYPIKYVVVHSVIMSILNVVLISLQIVAIKNDAAISYIGSAIWAGVYNLITVIMAILTVKYRNSTFVTITTTMKLFGMIVSFGGFIVVQIVAFYHYNCIAASYYRSCYNKDMKSIHYAIIMIGIPTILLNISFFLYFQLKVFGRFGQRFKATF